MDRTQPGTPKRSSAPNCSLPTKQRRPSTATVSCAQSDDSRPGRHFAIATGEVCRRLLSRDNTLTLQSVPSHEGIEGVMEAAENVEDSVDRGYLRETSFAHMTRSSVR